MAIYSSVIAAPGLFKIFFGMIIDSQLVPKRKYYLSFFGFWSFVMLGGVGW